MKQLVGYALTFKNEAGIIENGLGDWCPPRWDRQDNPDAMECHPYVSATAYFYDVLGNYDQECRIDGGIRLCFELRRYPERVESGHSTGSS